MTKNAETLKIGIRISDNVGHPTYQSLGAAGCDLISNIDEVTLYPGERKLIGTGLFLEIPHGFEAQVRPRSGLALKHGITVLNTPGTIDCFTADSVISTPDGKKTIFDLKINDVVFSFNEETLQIENDIVSAIVDVGIRDVLTFELNDGTELHVTPGTMIYTRDGLKRADELTENDEIIVDHDD